MSEGSYRESEVTRAEFNAALDGRRGRDLHARRRLDGDGVRGIVKTPTVATSLSVRARNGIERVCLEWRDDTGTLSRRGLHKLLEQVREARELPSIAHMLHRERNVGATTVAEILAWIGVEHEDHQHICRACGRRWP